MTHHTDQTYITTPNAIANEFNRQFVKGLHSVATLAVFKDGKQVVDLTRGAPHALPLFRVFSMGKPLAAAVLWRYKARGHFDWDTPVAEFWPEFGTRGKSAVTIGHILSHSAGLASHETIPVSDYNDWGRVISHIEDMTTKTEPGKTVHYHSRTFGWIVGEIAARVSRLSFDESFAREVTLPLGLNNTTFAVDQSKFGRLVPVDASYEWSDSMNIAQMNALATAQITMPAGSMITTANDVAKFYSVISGKGKLNGVTWLPEEVIYDVTALYAEGADQGSGNYSRVGLGVRLPSTPPNQYASCDDSTTVGHGGMATCTGWASLTDDISVAYITNRFQLELPNKMRLHDMSMAIRKSLNDRDLDQVVSVT
jgi:CubicO group peptidase (beta-lactamase class C family)